MWHFDSRGFVSVVAYDPKKDRNPTSKFPQIAKQAGTHLLVRARIKEDLDMIKAVVPSLHVETDKSADYAFRAVVTRKQFKKFLAESVDKITYDSHFKEAARDNSPKADGRYSAMMSVWSAMAKLQPHTPYGGYSYFGGGSKSSKSTSSTWSKPAKALPPSQPGYKDMEAFLEAYKESGATEEFRRGNGPRTGFKVGDEVRGYFEGVGTVSAVSPAKVEGGADLLQIKTEDKHKNKKTATYLSNYVIPNDLPEVKEKIVDAVLAEDDDTSYDLMWIYDHLLENPDANSFDTNLLGLLDDDAFELLTRAQERQGGDEKISREVLNELHEDVNWESASEDEKRTLATDGVVPEKYVQEATKLFSHKS